MNQIAQIDAMEVSRGSASGCYQLISAIIEQAWLDAQGDTLMRESAEASGKDKFRGNGMREKFKRLFGKKIKKMGNHYLGKRFRINYEKKQALYFLTTRNKALKIYLDVLEINHDYFLEQIQRKLDAKLAKNMPIFLFFYAMVSKFRKKMSPQMLFSGLIKSVNLL